MNLRCDKDTIITEVDITIDKCNTYLSIETPTVAQSSAAIRDIVVILKRILMLIHEGDL